MSSAIQVVSSASYAGKSGLIIGLALELKARGYKVGYMKPVGAYPVRIGDMKVDEDAYFIADILGLTDDLSDISPYSLTWENLRQHMRKRPANAHSRVSDAFERISEGKDIVLIEGARNYIHGEVLGLSAASLTGLIESSVLLLDTFNDDLTVDRLLLAKAIFGESFIGAVLNWVPQKRLEFAHGQLRRYMEEKQIEIFGSIPADIMLRAITVNDLAAALGGKVIAATDKGEELVESMMVGAMGQEQALQHFKKQSNKVVITGGDRAEIQLAAMETQTKALVLSGGHKPGRKVIDKAEEMGVPVIVVEHDTVTAVEMVDAAIDHQKVDSPVKIDRMRGFIKEGFNLDLLLEQAGVGAPA